MSWGEDGIVFAQATKGILKVSENGGKPEVLVSVENGEFAHSPQVLPGGEAVLYSVSTGSNTDPWDSAKIFVQPLEPGSARQPLIRWGRRRPLCFHGPYRVCVRGTLFAVPFDLGRLQVTGVGRFRSSRASVEPRTGSAQFSFSNTGSLIYVPGPDFEQGERREPSPRWAARVGWNGSSCR